MPLLSRAVLLVALALSACLPGRVAPPTVVSSRPTGQDPAEAVLPPSPPRYDAEADRTTYTSPSTRVSDPLAEAFSARLHAEYACPGPVGAPRCRPDIVELYLTSSSDTYRFDGDLPVEIVQATGLLTDAPADPWTWTGGAERITSGEGLGHRFEYVFWEMPPAAFCTWVGFESSLVSVGTATEFRFVDGEYDYHGRFRTGGGFERFCRSFGTPGP